ncbi:MAG: peptidoglycan DD-metalloendopeptidase family protein [Bacillaceae bacterium]|nr:peptidoglycan DD-metalloendopeptidase family protein [Bacillaceae bacterium]
MKTRNKTWTILLMSDTNKPVIQLKIPKIIPYIASLVLVTLSIWLYISETSGKQLEEKNQILTQNLVQMKEKVDQQREEIAYYEQEASRIEEKLIHLDQLERELTEMISSLNPDHIESVQDSGPMGGLDIPFQQGTGQNEIVQLSYQTEKDRSLTVQYSELEEQLPDFIKRYEKALENIEKINEKLKSVPTFWPTDATRITSTFGKRSDPFTGREAVHTGIDLAGPWGTPIYAAADGTVIFSGRDGGYGNSIVINHNSTYQTRYGHMSRLAVNEGDKVKKGDVIGYMGSTGRSTGSHLHYEIIKNGNMIDPYPYMMFLQRVLNNNH